MSEVGLMGDRLGFDPALLGVPGGIGALVTSHGILTLSLAPFAVRRHPEEAENSSMSISLDSAEFRDSQQTKISP